MGAAPGRAPKAPARQGPPAAAARPRRRRDPAARAPGPPRDRAAVGRKKRPTGKPAAGRAGLAPAADPSAAPHAPPATPSFTLIKVVGGARGAESRVSGGRLPAARPPGSPAGRTVRGILPLVGPPIPEAALSR